VRRAGRKLISIAVARSIAVCAGRDDSRLPN
jgi:hypothetical protein